MVKERRWSIYRIYQANLYENIENALNTKQQGTLSPFKFVQTHSLP